MNDAELIWEAYQNSHSDIVYHVSRHKFTDIRPWSHFTKSKEAAKDIINTDKSEGKYTENSKYYIYEFKLKCSHFMRMHDIHGYEGSSLFGGSTWEKNASQLFSNPDPEDKEYQKKNDYIINSILNEIENRIGKESIKMYLKLIEIVKHNKSLLNKDPYGTEWENVIDEIKNEFGFQHLSTIEEKMDFYRSLMPTIETVLLLMSRESYKKWQIWLFDDQYEDSLDKFSFKIKLLEDYYDGIVYHNMIERGGDSYVIFDPKKCLTLLSVNDLE